MKLLVLALSYYMVFVVGKLYVYLEQYSYYLLSAGTCFVLFMLCVGMKDRLLSGYAYIQLIAMVIYVQMITPEGFYTVDVLMYGGVINYANVILLYEMILLAAGTRDVYNAMHRYFNDNYMHSYRSSRDC